MSCQWGLNGDSACIFQWNTGRQLILLFKRHWFLKQKTRQRFPLCCRLSLFRAFCFPWIQIACLFFFYYYVCFSPRRPRLRDVLCRSSPDKRHHEWNRTSTLKTNSVLIAFCGSQHNMHLAIVRVIVAESSVFILQQTPSPLSSEVGKLADLWNWQIALQTLPSSNFINLT